MLAQWFFAVAAGAARRHVRTEGAVHAEVLSAGEVRRQEAAGCPCADFPAKVQYVDSGGNGYVVRFTKACGRFAPGTVAKAFVSEGSQRDDAAKGLARLPSAAEDRIAGLAVPGDAEASAFDCLCAEYDRYEAARDAVDDFGFFHKYPDEPYTPASTCAFMALQPAGKRTAESCLRDEQVSPAAIKGIATSVVAWLQRHHANGWTHYDMQPKNVMLDEACDPATLRVIDADDMWQAPEKAPQRLRDYCKFFSEATGGLDYDDYGLPAGPGRRCQTAVLAAFRAAVAGVAEPCSFKTKDADAGALENLGSSFVAAIEAAPECA